MLYISTLSDAGAVPGTAEQGFGNQMESAPAADHGLRLGSQQPGAFLRILHQLPAQAAGLGSGGEGKPGGRDEEHAGPGGRLQKEVRASTGTFLFWGISREAWPHFGSLTVPDCTSVNTLDG